MGVKGSSGWKRHRWQDWVRQGPGLVVGVRKWVLHGWKRHRQVGLGMRVVEGSWAGVEGSVLL